MLKELESHTCWASGLVLVKNTSTQRYAYAYIHMAKCIYMYALAEPDKKASHMFVLFDVCFRYGA